MARKGGGKGRKGKAAYELQEEENDPKDGGGDQQEEDDEWWVGAVCALSRDEGFACVPSRKSVRPQCYKGELEGVEVNDANDDDERMINEDKALFACGIRGGIGGGPVSRPLRPIGGEPFSHHRMGDPSFGENRRASAHARKGTPPHARDEGFLGDLRSEAEWPGRAT
jgi:hypothetical protein